MSDNPPMSWSDYRDTINRAVEAERSLADALDLLYQAREPIRWEMEHACLSEIGRDRLRKLLGRIKSMLAPLPEKPDATCLPPPA